MDIPHKNKLWMIRRKKYQSPVNLIELLDQLTIE
jgi:hypothetical protein